MRHFKKVFAVLFLLACASTNAAFSSYVISKGEVFNTGVNPTSDNSGKNKVEFEDADGNLLKVLYVEDDYNLSLKDAPYFVDSENNPVKWTSGNIVLNSFDDSVDSDMVFTPSTFTSDEIFFSSISNTNGEVELDNYVISSTISLPYDSSGNTSVDVSSGNQNKLVNGDETIGLDNNTRWMSLKLNNDVILTSTINIGGHTGFWGSNSGWCQLNWQGFIIGNYSSLDLNGHDLIVTDGAVIDSYGLITDSSSSKAGNLVLGSGSTLYTDFVVEDHYRENSMPGSYINNGSVFSMYRCPYWQCNTIIYDGAEVLGKIRIYFCNVVLNKLYLKGDIYLIGSGQTSKEWDDLWSSNKNPWIQVKSKVTNSSHVVAIRKYQSTEQNSNLFFDKFTYQFYNSSITLNNLMMTLYINAVIIKINFEFNFDKCQLFVPPYFHYELYNSTLNLTQKVNFMPGSYLKVDSSSVINLVCQPVKTMDAVDNPKTSKQEYQPVGSLSFMFNRFSGDKNICDTRKGDGDSNDGFGEEIFYNKENWNSFWNKLPNAYCDLYGKIQFTNNADVQYHSFELGGTINLFNYSDFKSTIEAARASSKIRLYSASFTDGPNMSFYTSGLSIKTSYRLNVSGYYILPLVSHGLVVGDLVNNNYDKISYDGYRYDYLNGVIYKTNSFDTYSGYIFTFDSYEKANYLYKSNYSELSNSSIDSLDGSFISGLFSVSTHLFTDENNQSYMFYKGAQLPCTSNGSNSASASLTKFQGQNAARTTGNVTFNFDGAYWEYKN